MLLHARPAAARPEWHVGIQPALGLEHANGEWRPAFLPSLEADLLWGRDGSGQLALGPALELGTWAFDDLRAAALGEVLLPTGDLDLGLALGPSWRVTDHPGPALAGRVTLGYRPFNYSGAYATGFGVFAGADQPLSKDPATWMLGVHVDGMWTALPFVLLASWIRGNPEH